MKFAISQEQWSYFRQRRTIEFEGLLSGEDIILFNQKVKDALCQNLAVRSEDLDNQPEEKCFEAGRDLWRVNSQLKNMMCQTHLGVIASQLIETKPLRLGYDQFFPCLREEKFLDNQQYREFLLTPGTLKQISCFQGVLCGLFLCLSGNSEASSSGEERLFPTIPGNGIFFAPDQSIPFPELLHGEGYSYYLIVYARVNSVYVLNRGDPHMHALKRVGYHFGDRLSDEQNPIIYR